MYGFIDCKIAVRFITLTVRYRTVFLFDEFKGADY